MKRWVIASFAIVLVATVAVFATGLITGEYRREEACVLCRAVRYTGTHYGLPFERVEENGFTTWFRTNVDPKHGIDPKHPHTWQQSGCVMRVRPFSRRIAYECVGVPPIFMLRPEIQLEVIESIPDRATQVAVIRSLNSPDRRVDAKRVRLLIEYYYIDRMEASWDEWWRAHAIAFGARPEAPMPVPPAGEVAPARAGT